VEQVSIMGFMGSERLEIVLFNLIYRRLK